ncbi:hypothetical protein NCCP133_16340 [Cytobacillus sp. NCCP-133]|nr:hypothetical protein NCCP133_16340 [Cytobacillus sp. NCCP-133]
MFFNVQREACEVRAPRLPAESKCPPEVNRLNDQSKLKRKRITNHMKIIETDVKSMLLFF